MKNLISLLLSVILCLSLSLSVFADSLVQTSDYICDYTEEYENALTTGGSEILRVPLCGSCGTGAMINSSTSYSAWYRIYTTQCHFDPKIIDDVEERLITIVLKCNYCGYGGYTHMYETRVAHNHA